MKLKLRGTD